MIRHGTTEENKAQILIGQLDPPLTEDSRKQIRLLKVPFKPDIVYSSPQRRAFETAVLLFPRQEIIPLPELKERCFGDLQGKIKRIVEKKGCSENIYEFKDETTIVEHGGEPLFSLNQRINRFLIKVKESNAQVLAAVSHGTLISHMVRILLGEAEVRSSPNNLHVVYFKLDDRGKVIELRHNLNLNEL